MEYKIKVREDLELREIDVHQYKTLYNLVIENKEYLGAFLPWVHFISIPEEYMETLEEWKKGNEETSMLTLGIYHFDRLIGLCGFNTINRMNKSAEIGYWLSKDATRQGIMTACVHKLMAFGYDILGLNRITIIVDIENKQSYKIPERLMFTKECQMKEYFFRDNQFFDGYLYRMTKEEWEINKS